MSEKHNLVDETNIRQIEGRGLLSKNKPEKLKWLKDAGLGMFIHFSLDVQLGVVISHTLVGASEDYIQRYFEELPKTFNPKNFDADKIARLAKICGFQYIVITTKHHNGFCLWDTKTTEFNSMNTPFGRDLVREYVDSMRRYGLKIGFYFSPEDFYFLYQNQMPFAYREYPGFANALSVKPWEKTGGIKINASGTYSVLIKGLEVGKHYQCKPVVTCGKNSAYAFYGDEVMFLKG